MKSKNQIEINGRFYDAKTGKPVSNNKPEVYHSPMKLKTIDGVSKPRTKIDVHPTSKPIATPKPSETQHQPAAQLKRAPSSSVKQSLRKSVTLNRSAVKAPVATKHKGIAETPHQTQPVSSTALKHAQQTRVNRAQQVQKSTAIARFNHHRPTAPKSSASTIQKADGRKNQTNIESAGNQPSTKERLIEKAMANAAITHSTNQKPKQKNTKHIGKFASTALVGLLLVGYVAYLNIPSISMRVAAHRAGFSAAMPSYKPAGYSLKGPIAHSPGQVTVNFASNTDDRAFSLKQQPTTWDSTALLENYVTKQSTNYITYQDRGLTIYIYDGSNASWVNGGKLYNVEGKDAQLDTEQLLKLATSV